MSRSHSLCFFVFLSFVFSAQTDANYSQKYVAIYGIWQTTLFIKCSWGRSVEKQTQ